MKRPLDDQYDDGDDYSQPKRRRGGDYGGKIDLRFLLASKVIYIYNNTVHSLI